MAANEALLGILHNALAEDLLKKIQAGEASAAEMAVARGLLKDSHITCVPAENNAAGELQRKLDERRAKRETPQLKVVQSDDLDAATADAEYMMQQMGHG